MGVESIAVTESCWVELMDEEEVYNSGDERHFRL